MDSQMPIEPPPPPPLEIITRPRPGLFELLDGLPAHILVIVGLALTLLIPIILGFKSASLAGSREEVSRAMNLVELDLQQYKEEQEKKNKSRNERATVQQNLAKAQQVKQRAEESLRSLEAEKANLDRNNLPPGEQPEGSASPTTQSQMADLQRRIVAAQAEVTSAQEDIDRAQNRLTLLPKDDKPDPDQESEADRRRRAEADHNVVDLKKAYYDAQVSEAGTVSHLVVGWFGRLLLLLGLLIMTVQSHGLRQKILLFILLVVMISALSGINLNFAAQGKMGETPRAPERTEMPAPGR